MEYISKINLQKKKTEDNKSQITIIILYTNYITIMCCGHHSFRYNQKQKYYDFYI